MATSDKVQVQIPDSREYTLTAAERAWVAVSLQTQRNVVNRSRQKEVAGGPVWHLRGDEIKALDALIGKFQ